MNEPGEVSQRPDASDRFDRRAWKRVVLGFALLDLVLLLPVLLVGSGHGLGWAYQDSARQNYFWHGYLAERLGTGELPLWCPATFAGTPFLASLQAGVYYLPNLLYLAAPAGLAMLASRAAHLLWVQVGTWLLAGEAGAGAAGAVLSSVVFSLSTIVTYRIYCGGLGFLDAQCWMPWIFLGMLSVWRRPSFRGWLWLAAASAMQLLAGHAQVVYLTWLPLAILCLTMAALRTDERAAGLRGAGRFGLLAGTVAFAAALLAAGALLPMGELVLASNRTANADAFIGSFSLPPENLLTLLMPWFFGGGAQFGPFWGKGHLWETTLYLGLLPLLLAGRVLSRERRLVALPWFLLAELTLLLALGTNTPLFLPLVRVVPGMGIFRSPCKYVIPMTLALAVLAGLGLGTVGRAAWKARSRGQRLLLWGSVAGLLGLAGFLTARGGHAAQREWLSVYLRIPERYDVLPPLDDAMVDSVARQCAEALLRFVALWLVALQLPRAADLGRLPAAAARWGVVGVTVVDLLLIGMPYVTSYPLSFCRLPAAASEALRSRCGVSPGRGVPPSVASGPWRVALRGKAGPNLAMGEGLETVDGYEGILSRQTSEFYNAMEHAVTPSIMYREPGPGPGTRLLAQRYWAFEEGHAAVLPGLEREGSAGGWSIWRDPAALPRARLTRDFRVMAGRAAVSRAIDSAEFDAAGPVLLEEEPGIGAPTRAAVAGRVTMERLEPERVSLSCETSEASLLVLADGGYPSWRVRVDGSPARLLTAYGLLRAVAVPAGRHVVEFVFDPGVAKLGLAISAVAWLLLALALLTLRRAETRGEREIR